VRVRGQRRPSATSETSVAYRVTGDGIQMCAALCGTITLGAPEAGHLSTAFGTGRPPLREAFSSLQELFAKLAVVFNAYSIGIRRAGRAAY
jgi:hypothetical protein